MVYLWVDAEREPPIGWQHAQTVAEAKTIMAGSQVLVLSMDSKFADGTGHDLLRWMAANNRWPSLKPTVHSFEQLEQLRMKVYIEENGPYLPKIDVTKL